VRCGKHASDAACVWSCGVVSAHLLTAIQGLADRLRDEVLQVAALLDAEKAQALPEFAWDSGCELH